MDWLLVGIGLWSVVHLFPRLAPGWKQGLVERLGLMPYQGLFSLFIVASLVLMVAGWRGTVPTQFFQPPAWAPAVTGVMMALAAILFVSSRAPTDIRRVLRHPQLASVMLFCLAHMLSNGDSRSALLFSGLGLWAVVEILMIDHREGAWVKPGPFGGKKTAVSTGIGVAVWLVLIYVHPWLSGVPITGRLFN